MRMVRQSSHDHMRLGLFIHGVGHHLAAWRHPSVEPKAIFDAQHYIRLAETAEAARFDAIFLADHLAAFGGPAESVSCAAPAYHFEPLSLLAMIAGRTRRIGLIATVSASYMPPYHLARKFASLDNLSNGRAGWNCVTSGTDAEAANFCLDEQLPHAVRYARTREYVELVRKLWDGWDDDALVIDERRENFVNPAAIHPVQHCGTYFAVAGALPSARPVQGHPVIVQAGSSADGMALAAATADVVFTAQPSLAGAVAFYNAVKCQAADAGRRPDDIHILPGLMPFVAKSHAEAERIYAELNASLAPDTGAGLLSSLLGHDMSQYPYDAPVPDIPVTQGWQSRQKLLLDMARTRQLTVGALIDSVAASRGHMVIVGDPIAIADQMEHWFLSGAADGFNIMPATLPGGLDDFVTLVIPELQRRGLFRTQYAGTTLRDHLGLARPGVEFRNGSVR